ncbi:MAG: FAD-binding oxidoreductase [Micromonosporaceae bacterium]
MSARSTASAAGTTVADPVAALAGACAAVRPGGPEDEVRGIVPAAVAAPATVAEASELLRAAAGHGLAILPRGTGTRLACGPPPARCDLVVDTTRLDQIIEHAAGDLVVRVQAGLPVGALGEALAKAGQQLALDTGGTVGGTVGGLIATGAAGPRRLRYGTPRDLLIGITIVLADGTVASSGGKVVKNVAGYDLGKLFAGSLGTLGLIAEAAFRLHPLPAAAGYVTAAYESAAGALDRIQEAIGSQLVPSAAEIDRPAPGAPVSVALLLEGSHEAVPERLARMRDILGPDAQAGAAPPPWWGASPAGTGGTLLRIAFPAGSLARVLDAADEAAAHAGAHQAGVMLSPVIRGSAGAGVLKAGLDAGTSPDAVRSFVADLRRHLATPADWGDLPSGSVTVVRAPDDVRRAADAWGPVPAIRLMRAVKDQFDPGHVMSPGRFAGGF